MIAATIHLLPACSVNPLEYKRNETKSYIVQNIGIVEIKAYTESNQNELGRKVIITLGLTLIDAV